MSRAERAIGAYASFLVGRRWYVLFASALAAVLLSSGVRKLRYFQKYTIWSDPSSKALEDHERMRLSYGDNEDIVVVLGDDSGVFDNESLERVATLTEAIWKIGGVKRVDSLSNYLVPMATRWEDESPALAIGPSHVAAAGPDGSVLLWARDTWARSMLEGHEGLVESVLFIPDGRLVSGALDHTVRIWDPAIGKELAVLHGSPERISALACSANGRTILAGSYRSLVAFDSETGRIAWRIDDFEDYVTRIAVVGDRVFAASRSLAAIDSKDGRVLNRWLGDRHLITALEVRRGIVVGKEDGRVLTATGGTELLRLGGSVLDLAVLPDGRIAASSSDGTVRVEGSTEAVFEAVEPINDLEVDSTGRIFAAAGTGDVLSRGPSNDLVPLRGHRRSVRKLAVSAETLYSLGDDGDIYVWRDSRAIARLSRTAEALATRDPTSAGEPVGAIEVENRFRVPLDITIGDVIARLQPGETRKVERVSVLTETKCEADDGCSKGQYCDFELEEPTCITRVQVVATLPESHTPFHVSEVNVYADRLSSLVLPSSEPFAVREVALPSLDPRTNVGPLLEAHPEVKGALESVVGEVDPGRFILPAEAGRVADVLRAARTETRAIELLSAHAQVRLTPNRVPMEPQTLREAAYHLLRPPNPPAEHAVVNRALDTTAIRAVLNVTGDPVRYLDAQQVIVSDVRDLLARSGGDYHLVGVAVQNTTFKEYAQRDMRQRFPVFMLVCGIVLFVIFRSATAVLLTLGLTFLAALASMGAAGHAGATINNLTIMVPQMVIAACVGATVHIYTAFADRVRAGKSRSIAIEESIAENFMPGFWTASTTAVGCVSLAWVRTPAVSEFGWMSSIGSMVAWAISFTLLPALLAVLPFAPAAGLREGEESPFFGAVARKVNALGIWPAVAGLIVGLAGIVGVLRADVDSNPLRLFRSDAPFKVAADYVQARLTGPDSILVEISVPGRSVKRTEYVRAVERFAEWLRGRDSVVHVGSLVDIEKSMRRAVAGGARDEYVVPPTDGEVASLYDMYTMSLPAGRDVSHVVNGDENASLVEVRLENRSANRVLSLGASIGDWAQKELVGYDVRIAGATWLYSNLVVDLNRGFLQNFGFALLTIALSLYFPARSFRLGTAAILANVIPMAVAIGGLALLGESLSVSTLMACCVGLGIVVDDTIHFVTRYVDFRRSGEDHEAAIVRVATTSGRAVAFTTVILVSAGAIFAMSDFGYNRVFGLTMGISLSVGLAYDLIFMPSMIAMLAKRAQ